MNPDPTSLPRPNLRRWQPLRSGLVNLFKYDHEEFRFEQGRMVLRGNNGSGKSRVLALQLPFLFDGDTSSHRVEPDGDPGKRFEWNLLMGRYEERTGYTWVEFGRLEEDGTERFLTLGCGLRAVEGRGLADRWFFITSRRIGGSLSLVGESGIPLGRERLGELLEGQGDLYRTAAEYRDAVDRALFRLGTYRFEALVNLLIQLRKPQLSREFNETFLSSALSEALAPLDPEALSLVAEAYRGLDEIRTELENFVAARKAVSIFLLEYGQYAKIASRRRSQQLRVTHSAYEEAQRSLKKSEEEWEQAAEALTQARSTLAALELEQKSSLERVRVLESSPEMRGAQELQQAREEAERGRQRNLTAEADLTRARKIETATSEKCGDARARFEKRQLEAQDQAQASQSAASRAAFDAALVPTVDRENGAFARAYQRAELALETRRKALANLEEFEQKLVRLEASLAAAKLNLGEANRRHDAAAERRLVRETELAKNVTSLERDTSTWLQGLRRLVFSFPESLLESLRDWAESTSGDYPLQTAALQALQHFHQRFAHQEAAAQAALEKIAGQEAALALECAALTSGQHAGPEARAGIDPERRRDLPGAPFWRLMDFVPGLPDEKCAALEAGLEASGLLDAWVMPEGSILSATEENTILEVATMRPTEEGSGLDCWLRPDPEGGKVAEGVLRRLLGGIGTRPGEGIVWVAEDGQWQLGPLRGKWSKPAAHHIGQSAREAARQRRLRALEQERAELAQEAMLRNKLLAELQDTAQEAEAEARALPSSAACMESYQKVAAARESLQRNALQVKEAVQRVSVCREELEEEDRQYELTAEAYGLGHWKGRLRELGEHHAQFQRDLLKLSSSVTMLEQTREVLASAKAAEEQAVELRVYAEQASALAREEHAAAQTRREELESSIGSTVEAVLARLAAAQRETEELGKRAREATKTREDAGTACARLEERSILLRVNLSEKSVHREQAIVALRTFSQTGLLRTALPHLDPEKEELSTSAWVEIARKAEMALTTIDAGDAAWERSSRAIYSHFSNLQTSLGALSYRPEGSTEADFFVVRVPFQQRNCAVDEIGRIFAIEVEARERILEAREREIIENHLIGEISNFIHDRLHSAEEWVSLVNRELDERPTSTGMRLRFGWITNEEGPADFPEARRRLMRAAVAWTEDDRAIVANFLYQKLQAERSANPQKTWLENLTLAFDYRAWHRFVVERQQDGRWQRLTKRTFGTGSGGEKALLLTMPQFAAAAAHYRSADPAAPRLILLDEAFVGIDNENRANALGLLHYFDLDVVMTSEREWACYPTVPGIAIYQLAVRAGVDAVLATRWVWDGSKRHLGQIPPLDSPAP